MSLCIGKSHGIASDLRAVVLRVSPIAISVYKHDLHVHRRQPAKCCPLGQPAPDRHLSAGS